MDQEKNIIKQQNVSSLVKYNSCQYVKTFYEKHPEKRYKRLEYNKKWKSKVLLTNREAFLEKRRIINKRYYKKNKDQINERQRSKYAQNREKKCQKNREKYAKREISYYQENKEKILERLKKKYHEKNPNAKYRKKKDESIIPLPETIKKPISKVIKQNKGKTKLKQRMIENNLKKLQLKTEQFKNELLTNSEI